MPYNQQTVIEQWKIQNTADATWTYTTRYGEIIDVNRVYSLERESFVQDLIEQRLRRVHAQEEIRDVTAKADLSALRVRQVSDMRAILPSDAEAVRCRRCGTTLDYRIVRICCVCGQLFCFMHCVAELCDTCYSPPESDDHECKLRTGDYRATRSRQQ